MFVATKPVLWFLGGMRPLLPSNQAPEPLTCDWIDMDDAPHLVVRPPAALTLHDRVSRELGRRVGNRNFDVFIVVMTVSNEPEGVDYDHLAMIVENWLKLLDPDRRSG